MEGRLLHDRTDSGIRTMRDGVIEHRRVHLISHRLKLRGIADLVEEENGVLCPVEYKRGRRGKWENDEMQVCAQALCLEEMLHLTPLSEAAIFYAHSGRRQIVPLTSDLRSETERTVKAIWKMMESEQDPGAILTERCKGCSLYKVCLPQETSRLKKLSVEQIFAEND